jgi:hypothetical protein
MATQNAAGETRTAGGAMRSGAELLRSLDDGRQVFLDGDRVAKVSEHPAFRGPARRLAHLFDIAAAPDMRERMTYPSPKTGAPVWRAWQIPHTHADLRAKRLFSETWAEATFGLMGRTPDHVSGFFTGFAAVPRVFAAGGQQFADNVVRFYEHLRDNHLYASYAIVPPQIDRSKPAHKQSDPTLYAGVVKERDDGIVISGAQQLATAALFSDYLHLACIHPLQPGDEAYANTVAVPINAPGLKLYPRRAFARADMSPLDYPLTSRFDEADAGASLRKPPGAMPLRHQAALHDGSCQTHERDDRERCAPGRQYRDGGACGLRDHRRLDAAGARDGRDHRQRRDPVAFAGDALLGHGASVGAQWPHAGDHTRARRCRHDHAAVLRARLR